MSVAGYARRLPDLGDQAKGHWRSILPQLGVPMTFLDGKQRPCPVCGGKDRARFDDIDGHGTWYCNVCGAGNGITLAMKVLGAPFIEAAARVRELLPDGPPEPARPPRDEAKCRIWQREVWAASRPLTGTMGERYLRSRGCWLPQLADSPVLRFVPRLRAAKHESGYLPAIVAKVADAAGASVNVHRTFLDDERRAYRAMMPGAIPAGSAIRLGDAGDTLGIAEGIETALHAAARFGVPCWSAITAGGMERWEPPAGVSRVEICGDADWSFTGQASAYILARKLTNRREPIACEVHLPDQRGADWADLGMVAEKAA